MNKGICHALALFLVCVALTGCARDDQAVQGDNAGAPGVGGGGEAGAAGDLGPQAGSAPGPGPQNAATDAAVATDGASGVGSDAARDGATAVDATGTGDASTEPSPVADAGSPPVCPGLGAYALQGETYLNDIPAEASGIAYAPDTDSFFIAANLQGRIWEYDGSFQTLLRAISLGDMDTDTEGLAYLGEGWLAIAVESNYVYLAHIDPGTTSISGSSSDVQVYQPSAPPPVRNAGFEGIAFRPPRDGSPGRFFVCQEHLPMRVLGFDRQIGTGPFEQRSVLDGTLSVLEPWDAGQVLSAYVSDISGMAYDESSDTLLIVSQESSAVIRVDPSTGTVTETLPLPDTTTSEGIAFFDGCRLAVVSEPNRIQVFGPTRP